MNVLGFDPAELMKKAEQAQGESHKLNLEILRELRAIRAAIEALGSKSGK